MAKQVTLKPEIKVPPKTEEKDLVDINKVEIDEHRMRDTDANISWIVVGFEDCDYTKAAIKLIKDKGDKVRFQKMNLEWQIKLSSQYNLKRLPAIFNGHGYFGCISELENYYRATFFSVNERML